MTAASASALDPRAADAMMSNQSIVELMQHPKLMAAIAALKEDPKSYAKLVADDPELAGLFQQLQGQMETTESSVSSERRGLKKPPPPSAADDAPPPLLEADAAEAEAAKAEGGAAFAAGDFGAACTHYERAAALEPRAHVHWSNLAAARLRLGEPANALAAAEKCVALEPRWAKGHLRLGEAHAALGAYDQADAAYEAGLLRAEGALRLQLTKALQRSRDAAKRAPKPAAAKAAAAEEVEEISTAGAQEMTDAEIRQQISELNLKTAGARRDYAAEARAQTEAAAAKAREGAAKAKAERAAAPPPAPAAAPALPPAPAPAPAPAEPEESPLSLSTDHLFDLC